MAGTKSHLRKRSILRSSEESTTRSREIGVALRQAREQIHLSAADLCRAFGWGAPRVSRMESGQREASTLDIVAYLARAKATPEEFNRLKGLADTPANGYDLQRHPAGLPEQLPTLDFLQTNAKAMTWYEPRRIPSLLQTERYARTILRHDRKLEEPRLEESVQTRLARQTALKDVKQDFDATFFVDESALRGPVRHDVMEEQLLHLTLVACLPHCHVRIVPPGGFVDDFPTAFGLFDDFDDNSVLTVHTMNAMLVLEEDEDMTPYLQKLKDLYEIAHNERESTDRIAAGLT